MEENLKLKENIIPLKEKEEAEEKKEGKVTDLLYVPKYNYLYGKKTLWSQDIELDSILNQYKRIHILDKKSLKKGK